MASPETTCMQKNQTVCTNKLWWINLLKNVCCVRPSFHCVSNSLNVFLPLIFYLTFMMLWSPIASWWLQFNTFSQVGINYISTLVWSLILPGRPWPRGLALEIIMVADALMPNSEKLYVESPSKVIKFVDTFLINFLSFLCTQHQTPKRIRWSWITIHSSYCVHALILTAGILTYTAIFINIACQCPLWHTRAPSQYKDRLIYVWRFPC